MLWNDLITPSELTGFARAALDDYENPDNQASLQSFLPNQTIDDIVARVEQTDNGLVEVANFRAYDAELDFGSGRGGSRRLIELPALGRKLAVSEYDQIRLRNSQAQNEAALAAVQRRTVDVVRATADRMEQMRGIVINTGKATIDQPNFKTEDDFGRDKELSVTSANPWNQSGAKVLDELLRSLEIYQDKNNTSPGALLVSRRVKRALVNLPEFATQLVGGATRPGTLDQVQGLLDSYGIPQIIEYDRKVRKGGKLVNVLPEDKAFFLPSPGQSALGSTFWGKTLSSTAEGWNIAEQDRPGIVVGAYRNEQPPMITEVIADAIGLPILANANLVMDMKVLSSTTPGS